MCKYYFVSRTRGKHTWIEEKNASVHLIINPLSNWGLKYMQHEVDKNEKKSKISVIILITWSNIVPVALLKKTQFFQISQTYIVFVSVIYWIHVCMTYMLLGL